MKSSIAPFVGGCLGAVAGTLLLAAAVRRVGQQEDRQHEATRQAHTTALRQRADDDAELRAALRRVERLAKTRRLVPSGDIMLALSRVTARGEGGQGG